MVRQILAWHSEPEELPYPQNVIELSGVNEFGASRGYLYIFIPTGT
ncbi:MAG: hypothetical protein ACI9FD_001709 [Gammaproteobacteria bacterium]|jgi:hypothetical protein